MGNSKFRDIPGPKWFEVVCETNFSTSVHLGSLAIELRQSYFRCCSWICYRNLKYEEFSACSQRSTNTTYVKLHIKFVFQEVMNVPERKMKI